MKTKKEIEKQIKWLIKNKPLILRTSRFGDDHHEAIDAQIRVLQEDMDEDEIYKEWPDEEAAFSESAPANVRDAALDARRWQQGEEGKESPEENWRELVKKK